MSNVYLGRAGTETPTSGAYLGTLLLKSGILWTGKPGNLTQGRCEFPPRGRLANRSEDFYLGRNYVPFTGGEEKISFKAVLARVEVIITPAECK